MSPAITSNPSSALGDLKNGWPFAISYPRKKIPKIRIATATKAKPTNERCLLLRPRTTSAPQPTQTLTLSGTCVWQCGHTKIFTGVQAHCPYQSTSNFRELPYLLEVHSG